MEGGAADDNCGCFNADDLIWGVNRCDYVRKKPQKITTLEFTARNG
jgi:hypothetical protein